MSIFLGFFLNFWISRYFFSYCFRVCLNFKLSILFAINRSKLGNEKCFVSMNFHIVFGKWNNFFQSHFLYFFSYYLRSKNFPSNILQECGDKNDFLLISKSFLLLFWIKSEKFNIFFPTHTCSTHSFSPK